jgi:hypothetical protein
MMLGVAVVRRRGWWLPGVRSQRATRRARRQLAPDLVEISQCEHGLRAGQVLSQVPVPHFDQAPQVLDQAERMLAAGAGRERAQLIFFQRSESCALELGRRLIR